MTLTFWVGEQFQPDGSAIFQVLSDSTPGGHPTPQANQAMFGPWASQAKAQSEIDSGKFRVDAQHIYRGSNVGKGPGGLSVPKNQAPTVPKNPYEGLAAIGHFFDNVSQRQFWIRIAEVTIGGLLVAIALNKIFEISSHIEKAAAVIPKIPV